MEQQHCRSSLTLVNMNVTKMVFCSMLYAYSLNKRKYVSKNKKKDCEFLANYVPKCQMSSGPYGPIFFTKRLAKTLDRSQWQANRD